jgi:hypothetical protein
MVTSQPTLATSPGRIRHSLLLAMSRSKGAVGNLLLANLSISLLTYLLCPTGIYLLKTTFSLDCLIAYCVISPKNIFPITPKHIFPRFLSIFNQPSKTTVIPTNVCLTCRYFHSDGTKIKERIRRGKSFPPASCRPR